MASPLINQLSASMGSYNSNPIVNISFKLQHDDGLDVDFPASGVQYAYASASGVWYDASVHSSTPTTGLTSYDYSPGRSTSLKWDVKTDADEKNENMYIRLQGVDPSGNYSTYISTAPFEIATIDPTVTFVLDSYTTTQTVNFEITPSSNTTYYRTGETESLNGVSWNAIPADDGISIIFSTDTEETKNVYVQVRDDYYNTSTTASDSIVLHSTAPANDFLRINGTIPNNEFYTGITIDENGSFTPDRNVTLDLYATSLLDVSIYISGDVEAGDNVETWIPYIVDGTRQFSSQDVTLQGTDYNWDANADVQVTYKDEAGNQTVTSKTIRCNTKLYECSNRLLREPTASYTHQILEATQLGTTTIISETQALEDTYIRNWNEIFHPDSHNYPREADGTIDESICIQMNGASNSTYDAVQISDGDVVYDTESRPITVDWTNDGTKDYGNLESSYGGEGNTNLEYWIIDNTGYGDIDLEFEYFHVNPNSFGPPYNNLSPYDGDHLVIYDASDAAATQETVGATGEKTYTLTDSSVLEELYAYTGEGNEVIELSTGYSVNADSNGGFSVPTIRGINRVCLIFYSDASTTSSGFKLKASEKHSTVFRNYDVDETNGEVWIHKYPNGASSSNDIRMIYDYYDTEIDVDLDTGTVTFVQDPSGVVSSDYTYYVREEDKIAEDSSRLFVSSNDDFIDYLTPDLYVTPSGQIVNKTAIYLPPTEVTYPTAVSPSGKISSYFTIDKDRGVVEYTDATSVLGDEFGYVPEGRVTIDYFYHTYKRLTNDGYGTLEFRDSTIVADDTPLFPDYTWIDVKLVNEGDAILEDGKMKFLSRGFDNDNDGTIDQVLDVNRPWDVQQGTAAETYDKTAMQVAQNYTFDSFCTKDQAKLILSNWKDQSFGFDVYARTVFYGRVVWVLGGTSGSSYPSTSIGKKTFSAALEGKYYNIDS